MFDDLESKFYTDLRCGIVNTFIDPYDKKEQERAYQRMWKNAFRVQNPEKYEFYNRNQKENGIKRREGQKGQTPARHEWYMRNKKKQRAKAREKYLENHEAELKRCEEYRNKNRDKTRKNAIEYYYKNRAQILEKDKTDEARERNRVYAKKWTSEHPDKVRQYQNTPKMKKYYRERGKTEKYKLIAKKARQKESARIRVREKMRAWRHCHVVETRVKAHVGHALKAYASGKKYSSKAYGIDYHAIATKLGEKPGPTYDADKIIPASMFDLNDLRQVKICFSPDNYQWLEHIENIRKGGKNRPETVAKYMPILKAKLEAESI